MVSHPIDSYLHSHCRGKFKSSQTMFSQIVFFYPALGDLNSPACVLFYYVCIAVSHILVAGLVVRSRYSEGPTTSHLGKGFSWFPCVYKQMLRWFPRFQVATACSSCSPSDLNFLNPYFIFMYVHYNHCHRATAHLQLNILLLLLLLLLHIFLNFSLFPFYPFLFNLTDDLLSFNLNFPSVCFLLHLFRFLTGFNTNPLNCYCVTLQPLRNVITALFCVAGREVLLMN